MLKEHIRADMIAAMKAKDNVKTQTLRGCLAAFTNELVAKNKKPTDELTDPEIVVVLKRLTKQRKDSIEQFTAGNRPELAAKESEELHIIESYLPAGASREEIEKIAKAKIAEHSVIDSSGTGKLIGAIMKEFDGRADGNDVREVLSSLLPHRL